MKKIRIDYYRFRLKKGRADVLLQKVKGQEEYCLPCHYVQENEYIVDKVKSDQLEDDGDLVILDVTVNDCHLSKSGKEWMPLHRLLDITLSRNEHFHVWYNILCCFLTRCPKDGDSGVIGRAEAMLEDVRIRMAKKKYLDSLQSMLDGERIIVMDAHVTPPDPELIRRERETLEHFRLVKGEGYDEYSYYPVDLEVFGCEIEPILPFKPDWDAYVKLFEE